MKVRLLFITFAVLTFVRPALYLAGVVGVVPRHYFGLVNLPFSPQPPVFTHPVHYRAIYICIKKESGESSCFNRNWYSIYQIHEPYYLGKTAFNHGIEGFLSMPETEFGQGLIYRTGDYICRDGVKSWILSFDNMNAYDETPKEGHYYFKCS